MLFVRIFRGFGFTLELGVVLIFFSCRKRGLTLFWINYTLAELKFLSPKWDHSLKKLKISHGKDYCCPLALIIVQDQYRYYFSKKLTVNGTNCKKKSYICRHGFTYFSHLNRSSLPIANQNITKKNKKIPLMENKWGTLKNS